MKKNSLYSFFKNKELFIIVLIALMIRMLFFISLRPWNDEVVNKIILVDDAMGYHQLASSILSDNSFEKFSAFRTPGYPVFVALLYRISSNNVWFVLLIQIILNVFSVLLVYKIAFNIFSQKIALISAFLFAIDIHQALYAVTLLTDILFVFLFLSSIYYLCKSIKENNISLICLSALFLGIATLVRPISYMFPIVAVLYIFILNKLTLKIKITYSTLFCTVFVVTISPWLIHNYLKYDEAKLSSITGSNLLFYNVAYTEVYRSGKTIEQVRNNFNDLAIQKGMDNSDRGSFKNSKIFKDIAVDYINANFFLYCKRHTMGIINMYIGLGTKHIASIFKLKSKTLTLNQFSAPGMIKRIIDFFKNKTTGEILIAIGLSIYLLINYFFSFIALLYLVKRKERNIFLFAIIILYFSVLTGVVGLVRYRLPIMPFTHILCSVGIFYFVNSTTLLRIKKKATIENI